MKEVIVKEADLQRTAEEGMDAFVRVFTEAIHTAIGGELNAENLAELNADQITLLGYEMLRDEVMTGGSTIAMVILSSATPSTRLCATGDSSNFII